MERNRGAAQSITAILAALQLPQRLIHDNPGGNGKTQRTHLVSQQWDSAHPVRCAVSKSAGKPRLSCRKPKRHPTDKLPRYMTPDRRYLKMTAAGGTMAKNSSSDRADQFHRISAVQPRPAHGSAVRRNPNGPIRCNGEPTAAQRRAILPVLGGISGSTNATRSGGSGQRIVTQQRRSCVCALADMRLFG